MSNKNGVVEFVMGSLRRYGRCRGLKVEKIIVFPTGVKGQLVQQFLL